MGRAQREDGRGSGWSELPTGRWRRLEVRARWRKASAPGTELQRPEWREGHRSGGGSLGARTPLESFVPNAQREAPPLFRTQHPPNSSSLPEIRNVELCWGLGVM